MKQCTCATRWAITGCDNAPQTPQPSAAANVSDSDVTEHVKTGLQQNDAVKGFDIAVVTTKGDVRLSGEVNLPSQMETALRIARAAEGAHTIHNEITLKK